jgi:hypothetical protein
MVLIYPTLAATLITAVPQWIDRVQALTNNVQGRNYHDALVQRQLYAKNIDCTTAPFDWYINPSNIDLDATICQSGDVYLRATSPTGQANYYFVAVDQVLGKPDAGSGSLFPAAQAAERLQLPATPAVAEDAQRPQDLLTRVQIVGRPAFRTQTVVQTSVVCTKFLDSRRVLRHLRTPQACFDEIVDSLNGRTVSRTQVACRRSC